MAFRSKGQSLVGLIVITTLTATFCDNRPKYCQCITSDGYSFSAFAKYFVNTVVNVNIEKYTEFWLYQNKHKCQMFIRKQTEIDINTFSKIKELEDHYRQWYGFYYNVSVLECLNRKNASNDLIQRWCRWNTPGMNEFTVNKNITDFDFNTSFVFIEKPNTNPNLGNTIFYMKQNKDNNQWIRSMDGSNQALEDLIADIDRKVYINAVFNAFDSQNMTNGYFILVTHEGIPKYCYKSYPKEETDRCKTEKLKIFMPKCYSKQKKQSDHKLKQQTAEKQKQQSVHKGVVPRKLF